MGGGGALFALPQEYRLGAECQHSNPRGYIAINYRYQASLGYRTSRLLLSNDTQHRRYTVQLRPGTHNLYLYHARIGFAPHTLHLPDADYGLTEFSIHCGVISSADNEALYAGLDLLLDPKSRQLWRRAEWQIFRWHLYPDIIIIDTATFAVLSHFFKRLAFYTEKVGYQGTIPAEEELAGRYAWRGHNYNAQGLAAFFQEARRLKIALNSSEQLLLQILLQEKLVIELNGVFLPGRGGILGISWQSPPAARHVILAHEMLHGIFYSVTAFRAAILSHWNALPDYHREAWRELLRSLTYTPTDRYLMVNEFHAYLLMHGRSASPARLHGLAARAVSLGNAPHLQRLIDEDPTAFAQSSTEAARALRDHSGLESPNLWALQLVQ